MSTIACYDHLKLCNDHRWSAAEDLDFCPPCERKVLLAAATPKQIELFGSTVQQLEKAISSAVFCTPGCERVPRTTPHDVVVGRDHSFA